MVDIMTCFKARRLVYLGKKGLKQKKIAIKTKKLSKTFGGLKKKLYLCTRF